MKYILKKRENLLSFLLSSVTICLMITKSYKSQKSRKFIYNFFNIFLYNNIV